MKKWCKKIESFWKKSLPNKLIISIIFSWILLAIVFGIYDLEISKTILNQNSFFANFIDSFGEIPALLLILFSSWVVSSKIKLKNKFLEGGTIFILFMGASSILFYLITIFFSLELFNNLFYWFLIILINFLASYLLKTKFKKFSKKNYLIAKLTLIFSAISIFIIQFLKEIWGRVRFNDLVENFTNFTEWYLPQGMTGGHSFPSGHVMFGWLLLPLILFFIKFKNTKKYLISSGVILWGLIVAMGRIVGGYHYASDVLFSTGIVTILFLVLCKKYFIKS